MNTQPSRILAALPPVVPTGCTTPVSESLPAALDRLIAAADPLKVILFGSYASGAPTPDSDIDLLVVLEGNLPVQERYNLVSEAFYPRPFPLDLLVLTREELEQRLGGGGSFLADVVAHGRVL